MAITRRTLGGLAIGGSAAAALSACSGDGGDGESSGGGEVVWALSGPWEAWNQTTASGNSSTGNQATTPMIPLGQIGFDFDPDGNPVYDDAIFDGGPELVSEEPMQLQYTLKEGAQWSDGKPVRVEDFIFYWYSVSGNEEHANQEKAVPASTDWGSNVTAIEETEEGTILVTYREGYIDPEWAYTAGVYVPSHFAEENGFENWQSDPEVMGDAIAWFNENLWDVVTGPYIPVDYKLGEYITYEINENYQGSVKPTIEKLTVQVVDTLANEVTELRQGNIAGCWPNEFFIEELEKLDENDELVYEIFSGSIWAHLDFNTDNAFLSDVELRRAVYTVVDIADMAAKSYPGTEIPWKGSHFFSEGLDNYVDYVGETTQGTGDVDAARQILTDAGYTWNGEDKLVSPDGEPVTFNFRFGNESELSRLTGDLLQSYLVGIGIDLELVAYSNDDFIPVLTGSEFDWMSFVWVGNPAFTTAPTQFFRSDSNSNFGSYSSPELDEAVDKVRTTFDIDEAAAYANEAGAIATSQAYVLPLWDRPQSVIYNTNLLSGVTVNRNSQSGPLFNVREWTYA
ncbi:ABC transporter substrate-binding protein [Glycomyces albus]